MIKLGKINKEVICKALNKEGMIHPEEKIIDIFQNKNNKIKNIIAITNSSF